MHINDLPAGSAARNLQVVKKHRSVAYSFQKPERLHNVMGTIQGEMPY